TISTCTTTLTGTTWFSFSSTTSTVIYTLSLHDALPILAEKGYFVIRYDNRDVGKSTAYPPGIPPYTLEDLVHDVIRVLDAYNIRSEEHTSELQSRENLVCRLLLEKKNEYLWCRCTVELG